ncbi:MAG: 50S ribosomal protein L1 [Candidatus Aminicenantia bacterium]
MNKRGKKYENALKSVEMKEYAIEEAIELLKKIKYTKFDESVDISMRLGVDPKHSDQMVRGTVVLPNGTGKKKRVVVIASGEKVKEAESVGAEYVGGEELIEKIAKGWLDFEAIVTTPDMMKSVSKLGKILGARGLMPSPKTGTVTFDIEKAVREIKSGRIEFRIDKSANLHASVAKISFPTEKIVENIKVFVDAVVKAKPPASKGKYIKSLFVSSTMSPSIRISLPSVGIK